MPPAAKDAWREEVGAAFKPCSLLAALLAVRVAAGGEKGSGGMGALANSLLRVIYKDFGWLSSRA